MYLAALLEVPLGKQEYLVNSSNSKGPQELRGVSCLRNQLRGIYICKSIITHTYIYIHLGAS